MVNIIIQYRYCICFIYSFLFSAVLTGQQEGVRAASPFRFTDGVYENFSQVLANRPVPESALLIADDYDDPEFFIRILSTGSIRYTLPEGGTAVIDNNKIWGFACGGELYVRWIGYFSPLYIFGTISCFFLNDEKYRIYRNILLSNSFPSGRNPEESFPAVRYRDLRKYLIDFRTGKILKLNVSNLSRLLKDERTLYHDYRKLPLQSKKKLVFHYIGLYNEKNPLYLPLK